MGDGYFKFMRSDESEELMIHEEKAFKLLSIIAFRAKWKNGFSANGLNPGEAMIGDYESCGLTRQEYRTACNKLKTWGFVTTRTTNRGTIAKICDTRVYDINIEDSNHQNNQQATIKQPLTKNVRKKRMK